MGKWGTVDFLTASNNNVGETRTAHFIRLLHSVNGRRILLLLAKSSTCFPPRIPRGIAFITSIPKASAFNGAFESGLFNSSNVHGLSGINNLIEMSIAP